MPKHFDDYDPHAASLAIETTLTPPKMGAGDAVICLVPDPSGLLRKDRIYFVTELSSTGDFVGIEGFSTRWFAADRFILNFPPTRVRVVDATLTE